LKVSAKGATTNAAQVAQEHTIKNATANKGNQSLLNASPNGTSGGKAPLATTASYLETSYLILIARILPPPTPKIKLVALAT